jgi:hypothetical protein
LNIQTFKIADLLLVKSNDGDGVQTFVMECKVLSVRRSGSYFSILLCVISEFNSVDEQALLGVNVKLTLVQIESKDVGDP